MRRLILLLALGSIARLAAAGEADGGEARAEGEMAKAEAAMDQHDFVSAISHYSSARALAPQSSGPFLGLGLAYAALARCDRAIPLLEEYLKRKPDHPHPAAQTTLTTCREAPAPAPETPAARAQGRVHVTTDPAGANVFFDDVAGPPIARTPMNLPAAAGPHVVMLLLEGYHDETRAVTVEAGQTAELAVRLRARSPAPAIALEPKPARPPSVSPALVSQLDADAAAVRRRNLAIGICVPLGIALAVGVALAVVFGSGGSSPPRHLMSVENP